MPGLGLAEFVNTVFFDIKKNRKLDGEVKRLVLDSWAKDVDQKATKEEFRERVEEELRIHEQE